jgi:predicted acylesterase/phospholipase RssA
VPTTRRKRILYYAPRRARFATFVRALREAPGIAVDDSQSPPCVTHRNVDLCWSVAADPDDALACLRSEYVHLLLIDMRCSSARAFESCRRSGLALLTRLDDTDDVEARYGFHRVIALVSGPDPVAVDKLLVELGARGVRTVLRDGGEGDAASAGRALDAAVDLIRDRHCGKRALCAAGGGITGIYFELGALKCLDDCLPRGTINTFDMFFGISAGAVVTSLLTVGYSPDEIMAAIAGVPGGRVPRLDFRLLRLGHLNYADFGGRLGRGIGTAFEHVWAVLRAREQPSLNSFLLALADSMPPPFHSDAFEKMLRGVLEQPGVTNDFRALPRPLYIGATDQDERKHVLFGDRDRLDVPISRAVQASLSVNPAFSSVEIDGRFYEDGAVTRTSNFAEAISRDATLVFVVDPFLPYVSKNPGMARSRGLLYNADQNIRTINYTRFSNARNWILRQHPQVSSYTFLPSNRQRRLLSVSPMDHRPYLEIWRGAYLSTLKRIHHLRARMRGDLMAHDLVLDTDRAEAVAERLRGNARPPFHDFFPDGVVELRLPPLIQPQSVEPRSRLRLSAM